MEGLIRNRDVAILIVIFVTFYLTIEHTTFNYSISPNWYIDQRSVKPVSANWKPIPPIISDLNGDFTKEIIHITKNHNLKIFSLDSSNSISGINSPHEIASVKLSNSFFDELNTPVALKTGYLQPYSDSVERTQVIVVVREDFTVSCYDASLKLLWEKKIAHKSHDLGHLSADFEIHDVAIFIAPLSLPYTSQPKQDLSSSLPSSTTTSQGLVVVGASMRSKSYSPSAKESILGKDLVERESTGEAKHIHLLSKKEEEKEKEILDLEGKPLANGTLSEENQRHQQARDLDLHSQLEHFSIFALDGNNGHVVWKHDGMEVKGEQYLKSLPLQSFLLTAHDLNVQSHHAQGIQDWNVFRSSLFAELPHEWNRREDTSFRLAHFSRRHLGSSGEGQSEYLNVDSKSEKSKTKTQQRSLIAGKSNPKSKSSSSSKKPTSSSSSSSSKREPGSLITSKGQSRFTGIDSPPVPRTASLPHDALEHIDHPNVLVAHTSRGLEVISLRTGHPITSLSLSDGRGYGDLDGDGVVDTVLVLEKPEDVSKHGPAFGYDVSGGQALKHCSVMVVSGLPPRAELFNGTICQNRNYLHDPLKKHTDYLGQIPSSVVATSPLILRTIDPKTMKESRVKMLVFMINNGVTTAYSGEGEYLWQISESPLWRNENQGYLMAFDVEASRVEETGGSGSGEGEGGHNTLYAQILSVGDSELELISRDGEILAEAEIPSPPVLKPILVDFDSDGVSDIVLLTADGNLLGYRVEVEAATQSLLVAIVLLSLITLVVFLMSIRSEFISISSPALSTATGQLKKSFHKTLRFAIKRSTDECHID